MHEIGREREGALHLRPLQGDEDDDEHRIDRLMKRGERHAVSEGDQKAMDVLTMSGTSAPSTKYPAISQ